MRITKKFAGAACIGKQVFRRRQADIDRLTPDEIARSRDAVGAEAGDRRAVCMHRHAYYPIQLRVMRN